MRIGQGFDAHRLVPDRRLVLGGVEIPASETGGNGLEGGALHVVGRGLEQGDGLVVPGRAAEEAGQADSARYHEDRYDADHADDPRSVHVPRGSLPPISTRRFW